MSSKNVPIVLMDIDGVLNTFKYADPVVHNDYQDFEANGWRITYSPSLLQRLCQLHNEKTLTIKWLTTWQSNANFYLREFFGFKEDLEVEGGDCDLGVWSSSDWWKLPIAKEALNKYDRVIWIDDEIEMRSPAIEWINSQDNSKLLTISPYPCLTHKDLDNIESWINS